MMPGWSPYVDVVPPVILYANVVELLKRTHIIPELPPAGIVVLKKDVLIEELREYVVADVVEFLYMSETVAEF